MNACAHHNDDIDIHDAYPLIDQVAAPEGRDDPSMDICSAILDRSDRRSVVSPPDRGE
jgi:hypothetical protein